MKLNEAVVHKKSSQIWGLMKPSYKVCIEMPKDSVIPPNRSYGHAIGLFELFPKSNCPKVSQALICEEYLK